MDSSRRKACGSVGSQDHMHRLRNACRIQHCSNGMDILELAINNLEACRSIHPSVDQGDEDGRAQSAKRDIRGNREGGNND